MTNTSTDHPFDYREFTTRNLGFVDAREQALLKDAHVYVCGSGGMGGACIEALVLTGVGAMTIADIDTFELSNLNRQLAATLDTVGMPMVQATMARCLSINPQLKIEALGAEWPDSLTTKMKACDVVVNGTDDLGASLHLYRTARSLGKPVVDAYASPLPSVYVTRADQPSPEERLSYPTAHLPWHEVTDGHRSQALQNELLWVLIHSSSRNYVDHGLAAEIAAGKRSRMSFAPMVISSGMLMAFESIALILGRSTATDDRGWFMNPWTARIERPRTAVVAAILRPLASRFLERQMSD